MRARNIKPGFFKSDQLAECSIAARYLFAGLWCMADVEGRLEYRPKRIKMEILPVDDVDVVGLLAELATNTLISLYGECDGNPPKYIWIPGFKRHQSPHIKEKQAGSELPPHPEDTSTNPVPDQSGTGPVPEPDPYGAGPADSGYLIPDSGLLMVDGGLLMPGGSAPPTKAGRSARSPSPQKLDDGAFIVEKVTWQGLQAAAGFLRSDAEVLLQRVPWTERLEREYDALMAEATRLGDMAAMIRAPELLAHPAFSELVVDRISPLVPGEPVPGDPGIWHRGREYPAREVCDLAADLERGAAA